MNEELLIAMVRNLPVLYDRYRTDFRDAGHRAKAWNMISKSFNLSVEDCMRTWKNLRERYAKELKVTKTQPDDSEHESKWALFDSLSFLQPYIRQRRTQGILNAEWASTPNEILLIEEVKKYPFLYDKNCEDFKDASKRERAWGSVAKILSMSVVECMRMWRNIRERYAKQLKLLKTNGEYSLHDSKWMLFEKLSFLKPHIIPRKVFTRLHPPNKNSLCNVNSEDNTKIAVKQETIQRIRNADDPLYTEEEMDEPDDDSSQHDTEQTVQEYIMMPASTEEETNQTIIQTTFEETGGNLQQKNQPSNSDFIFGNYVGQYLSEIMDTRKKNKLKISIIQLLHGDDN